MRSPELQAAVDFMFEMRRQAGGRTPTLEESRATIEGLALLFPLPDDIAVTDVDAGGVPGRWVTPPGADPDRTILFLHGGAYVRGSTRSHLELTGRLARAAGARALTVDYRLAPEHPFPAAVDDAVAAYRWLVSEGGAHPKRVAISGDSAGGGLTVAACLALRDAGDPLPAALALISPWVDLTCERPAWTERIERDPVLDASLRDSAGDYLAGVDPRTPLASPIFADLAGLPPTLIQIGTDEILFDDGRDYADAARAAGVDVALEVEDDGFHDYQAFATAPEAQAATNRMGRFLADRLAAARTPG